GLFFRQFALTIAVSTIISAFNSLTLSPALTALLLRPLPQKGEGKNGTPPLPRLAFPLAAAGATWLWLTPWLEESVPDLAGPLGTAVADTSAAYPWLLTPAAVLFAALVGWLLSRPLNALLSWCFQGFNAGFGHATKAYTGGVGKLLHFSVVVLV